MFNRRCASPHFIREYALTLSSALRLNLAEVYEALGAHGSCKLLALTAFYESHYVCFCYSQAAGQWIHYDDDTRRLVGRDFEAVREKCIAGRLHPQLLFYCLE